jgi:Acyl-CoA dehydrogenase, C-terminal domain
VVVLGAALMLGASEQFLALAGSGLPLRRKLAGHALAAALALFLTLLLVTLGGQSLTADVLAFLLAVIVVALVGGFVPAVLEAVAGSLLLHYAYELALGYARERTQGGVPIAAHQSVAYRLFHMYRKVEAARALARRAMPYNFTRPGARPAGRNGREGHGHPGGLRGSQRGSADLRRRRYPPGPAHREDLPGRPPVDDRGRV